MGGGTGWWDQWYIQHQQEIEYDYGKTKVLLSQSRANNAMKENSLNTFNHSQIATTSTLGCCFEFVNTTQFLILSKCQETIHLN